MRKKKTSWLKHEILIREAENLKKEGWSIYTVCLDTFKREVKKMKRNEIWIFVEGGRVVTVKATDPLLKVYVIDRDDLAVSNENLRKYEKWEALSENMPVVYED